MRLKEFRKFAKIFEGMYRKGLLFSFELYRSSSRGFTWVREINNTKCIIFLNCKTMNMEYLGPFSIHTYTILRYITLLVHKFLLHHLSKGLKSMIEKKNL